MPQPQTWKTFGAAYVINLFFVLLSFNPTTRIDEGVNPNGHLIVAARAGIEGTLPGVDGAFEMGHHRHMTSVGRSNTGNRALRAVGIAWVGRVAVFCNDVELGSLAGEGKATFAVSHPNACTDA